MLAHVMTQPGEPDSLELQEIPDPEPRDGWVLVEVEAFGINRSEVFTRQGHSGDSVTLPRVLGIECVGQVLDGGGTDLQPGQRVACAMGGLGRTHDGGYAEMTLVPRENVFPVSTALPADHFGALPESYLTAWGMIVDAVQLKPGQHVLIRAATSSVGMACISIAKDLGCTVYASSRTESKFFRLKEAGADEVILDRGDVAERVRDHRAEGVDGVCELVGSEIAIQDSLRACAPQGTVCMAGFLGYQWDYEFFPWMPSTVKLTLYSSETLTAASATPVMQTICDKVAAGAYRHNIDRVFDFRAVPDAHRLMEANRAAGKLVVKVAS